MRASNEKNEEKLRGKERETREKEELRTHWRHIVEQRGSEGRSRGCRWLPIESPFSVTERKFSDVGEGEGGTDWRRIECDQNESNTSDP